MTGFWCSLQCCACHPGPSWWGYPSGLPEGGGVPGAGRDTCRGGLPDHSWHRGLSRHCRRRTPRALGPHRERLGPCRQHRPHHGLGPHRREGFRSRHSRLPRSPWHTASRLPCSRLPAHIPGQSRRRPCRRRPMGAPAGRWAGRRRPLPDRPRGSTRCGLRLESEAEVAFSRGGGSGGGDAVPRCAGRGRGAQARDLGVRSSEVQRWSGVVARSLRC